MRTGRMPAVEASRFSMTPSPEMPRSAFDVRYGHKTTFNGGYLIPVLVEEILPGDSLKVDMNAFCRLSTPLVPMMDNLEFESYFFFVPNRLVWSNWKRFMGEQLSPSDTTTFLVPYAQFNNAQLAPASIGDYFGLTVNGSANTINVNALPFRAFNLIWNEWFRDEDLDNPVPVATGDGPDAVGTYQNLAVRRRHDYFTTARPWPQKPMNIGIFPDATGLSPGALGNGLIGWAGGGGNNPQFNYGAGAPVSGLAIAGGAASTVGPLAGQHDSAHRTPTWDNYFSTASSNITLRAQTQGVGGGDWPDVKVLINDLRTANMVQLLLERNARGGTRYTEFIYSQFKVRSPDARLQRPEYLGGGRSMIQVNPVAQTTPSGIAGTTTKFGELAGVGSGMVVGHGFSQSFTEHGFVLGLVCVKSFLTYQQGVDRMWWRRTQFDHYVPALAHLGEQAILSEEVYCDGSAGDVGVFGYQERWSEYKYRPSRTSGYFRSTVATPLDMWHLGLKFVGRPALNAVFVEENAPINRVLQTATNFGMQFLCDMLFDCRWARCMPMYSVPGLGGRL